MTVQEALNSVVANAALAMAHATQVPSANRGTIRLWKFFLPGLMARLIAASYRQSVNRTPVGMAIGLPATEADDA